MERADAACFEPPLLADKEPRTIVIRKACAARPRSLFSRWA